MHMVTSRQGRRIPYEWSTKREHDRIWNEQTITTDQFFRIVLEALAAREPLSIVRMSDGEDDILRYCKNHPPESEMLCFPEEWNIRFGAVGINCGEMLARLTKAWTESTYFAPDGERNHLREHFPLKDKIVHILYVDILSQEQRRAWFKEAGHVLLINGNPATADRMRACAPEDVKIEHVLMRNWTESTRAIHDAVRSKAPLVLWSGGPAGKYIGCVLQAFGKVAIDIGHGMNTWCAPHRWGEEGWKTWTVNE